MFTSTVPLSRIESLCERPRLIEEQANRRIDSLSWITKAMAAQMHSELRKQKALNE